MAKFTDAVRATLTGYFNAGDQPTEAQFTALILAIQEGIEEHDHAGGGDGDGVNDLVGPVGIGTAAPGYELDIVDAADYTTLALRTYSVTDGHSPTLFFMKSHHNTPGTLAETTDGDYLGQIRFYGVDTGPAWDFGARITAIQRGAAGAFLETDLIFETFTNAAVNANQLYLDGGTGCIGMGTATPVIPAGHVAPFLNIASEAPGIILRDTGSADVTRYITTSAGNLHIGVCDDDGANPQNLVTISSTGVVKVVDLAGVGARNVVAAADGTLSAP